MGSIEMMEGRSNGSMKDIRNGPKRSGSGSRRIQGKENNLLVGLAKKLGAVGEQARNVDVEHSRALYVNHKT